MAKFWALLVGAALFAAMLGATVLTAMSAGRAKQKAKAMKEAINAAQESNRIRYRVRRDPAERDRLHKKYRRD